MHPTPYSERQEWVDERETWRKSLPPPPVPDELLGLNLRPPDPRDHDMRLDPPTRAALEVGFPDTFDLVQFFTPPALNQGSIPSCVSHTVAHLKSFHEQIERRQWITYNAPQLHNETGPLMEGRWPDDVLKVALDRGVPQANGAVRDRIASYAFAPKTNPQEWASAIKAAISAQRPVCICFLLPQQFGWESGGGITSGYHEVLLIGYRPDAFLLLNSWGPNWSRNGMGWVGIDYLTQANWQNGYVLAHTVIDEGGAPTPIPIPIPDPIPTPIPDPQPGKVRLRAEVAGGGGLEFLKPGLEVAADGGGFFGKLLLTEVLHDQPQPQPQPQPSPTGLLVSATSRRVSQTAVMLSISVTRDGQPVPSLIRVTTPTRNYGQAIHGVRPATKTLWEEPPGTVVTLKARAVQGGAEGEASVVV